MSSSSSILSEKEVPVKTDISYLGFLFFRWESRGERLSKIALTLMNTGDYGLDGSGLQHHVPAPYQQICRLCYWIFQ